MQDETSSKSAIGTSNTAATDTNDMAPPAATNTSGQATPKSFRLLDLPVELVLRILGHAVIVSSKDDPINIVLDRNRVTPPPITQTCRLFRSEGIPLFYATNTFYSKSWAPDVDDVYEWINFIGMASAKLLSITMCWINVNHATIESRTWSDFVEEAEFWRIQGEKSGLQSIEKNICFRSRSGKLLIGSGIFGDCYEVVFRNEAEESEGLMRCSNIKAIEPDEASEEEWGKLCSNDFWVRESAPE